MGAAGMAVKLALFVGMTLLALQGISEMLKCVYGIGEAVSGTDDTKGGDAA